MFSLRYPEPSAVTRLLGERAELPLTYPEVGATRGELPTADYTIDRYGVELGRGPTMFERGCAAIDRFAMYPSPWTRVQRLEPGLRAGAVFATIVRHFGFYSVLPCRIVYTVDERETTTEQAASQPVRRFGFALGTLPGHAECGEERFLIEWHRDSDIVNYRVVAFSRPNAPLARIGKPIARQLQKRFARDSVRSMVRAVGEVS